PRHPCCTSSARLRAPGLYSSDSRGDDRARHSFPTRRSSDLIPNEAAAIRAWLKGFPGPLALSVEATSDYHFTLVDEAHALGHTVDRKSTRLNSSHVKISYAVFCLKKKREH